MKDVPIVNGNGLIDSIVASKVVMLQVIGGQIMGEKH